MLVSLKKVASLALLLLSFGVFLPFFCLIYFKHLFQFGFTKGYQEFLKDLPGWKISFCLSIVNGIIPGFCLDFRNIFGPSYKAEAATLILGGIFLVLGFIFAFKNKGFTISTFTFCLFALLLHILNFTILMTTSST